MCGRFTHLYTWKQVREHLSVLKGEPAEPLLFSYNVAPTQMSLIVRLDRGGVREAAMARWGLIPSWAKDLKIGASSINARADGVAGKAMFRAAFKQRRCVVPISGFYEWQALPGRKDKQPWHVGPAGGGILCLAGLWERWKDAAAAKAEGQGGSEQPGAAAWVESFTIITTESNQQMRPIHDRMPVVLQPEDVAAWLDPKAEPAALQRLLAPAPEGVLEAHRVSTHVNSPRNNDVRCVEPMEGA